MKYIYLLTVFFMGLGLRSPMGTAMGTSMGTSMGTTAMAVPTLLPASMPWIHLAERPDHTGYPRRGTRRGGGSRGGLCDLPTDVPPLTALMPPSDTWPEWTQGTADEPFGGVGDIVFSFTHRASPDLWFYLPYDLLESSRVELTLKDEADNTVSRSRLDTTATPTVAKIMRVSLAELGLTLMPATDYHWYLTVHCTAGPHITAGPPITVDGWINYQPMDGEPLPQSSNQFLVDRLSALAETQFSQPGNTSAQAEWQNLLESIGLGDITDIPRMDCCSFITSPQN